MRIPRTSSLRMITTSMPANATAAIVAIAYSAVAAPVSWEELEGIEKASLYTIRDAALLLERAGSKGLKGWGQAKQALPKA